MVSSIVREIDLRKDYFSEQDPTTSTGSKPIISSVYFGGGTPSLLNRSELERIFEALDQQFDLQGDMECTLEANPDDLDKETLSYLAASPINRLSIGIQSFNEAELRFMNRAHSALEAEQCILWAKEVGLEEISIDLIYGTPQLNKEAWLAQLEKFRSLELPHLSAYCLTVEENTALAHQIKTGKVAPLKDAAASEQFTLLSDWAKENNFHHYEISNLSKVGHEAVHNSSYWKGVPYLGLGPSAHSFDGDCRQWNIAHNMKYIKSIAEGVVPAKKEMLTKSQHFNEFVMTSLRTTWGLSLKEVNTRFGLKYLEHLLHESQVDVQAGHINLDKTMMCLTDLGRLYADRISSDLFIVE